MQRISRYLYRISSWQSIIVITIIYGLFLSQVMTPHAAEMQSFAGDWGAPDGHVFYTPEQLYAQLGSWSAAGRSHYIRFRLGLDPLWALTYTAFLISISSVALRKATAPEDPRRLLNLLPLIPMCADLLENALGISVVLAIPLRLQWLAWLLTATSCAKWVTLGIAHLIMLYTLGLAVRAALRKG